VATGWIIVLAIAYIGGLFAIANWADRPRHEPLLQKYGGAIYSLALAVYCTSWTYYGAVGSAVSSGWDYLPIYLGPVLLYLFGHRVLRKLLFVAKKHNVTSLTDFISARYGKRQAIAALTALLCLVVVVPYIALQLKAVTSSYQVLVGQPAGQAGQVWQDSALWSAAAMALFAILFGTRKLHLTEQNRGVMAAIAFESVVKLLALLLLAAAALYFLVPTPSTLWHDFWVHNQTQQTPGDFSALSFATKTLLALCAVFLLPRQFHVTFVENTSPAHLHQARRWFVAYLLLVTLVVLPVAMAGLHLFPGLQAQADSFVLLIPASQGWDMLSALVFIGGFSAATSMIVIATLALGTMISNDVVMPAILRRQHAHRRQGDYSTLILRVRRLMILVVMALSWGYYRWFARNYELAETGLLAFALIIQLAPAVLGGLYWKRGHAWGVYAGVSVGFVLWFYCLMLPQLVSVGVLAPTVLQHGALGLDWLRPTALFGLTLDPLSHGVFWSLGLNSLAYVLMSLLHRADLNDRLQAVAFVKPNLPLPDDGKSLKRTQVRSADMLILLERFVGHNRVREALDEFEQRHGYRPSADDMLQPQLLRHIERELAGVIGSSSAAAMVNAVLEGRSFAFEDVVTLFDDTREAIQFSRKILFSTLENLSQGVSVVDRDLLLVAWNKKYLEMFDYPAGMIRVGRAVADIVRFNAERGLCGEGPADEHVAKRISHLQNGTAHVFQRVRPDGSVIEIRGNPIPGGGFVTSFTDITEHVRAVQALAAAKEHLEQRVSERTAQISQMNADLLAEVDLRRTTEQQLLHAKAEAESANASKTRFLALASHDILQPLNAARLFAAALADQRLNDKGAQMLSQLDNSLKATEELMATLLDIARLDEGKLEFPVGPVDLRAMLLQLAEESQLLAGQKQLVLRVRPGHFQVCSHPTYLRRIVQNILSNAIKYTPSGKVLMGCRRRGDLLWIEVWDTGPGLSAPDLQHIFDDFFRAQATARGQQGVGLGLGVVQRMARSLGHLLDVHSVPGKGSCFRIAVPLLGQLPPAATAVASIEPEPAGAADGLWQILCVDDDNTNLDALSVLLTQWQLGRVACVDDAQKALARVAAVDVLIADYQLGQAPDGLQLFLQLKQRWPQLRGVLVSAAPEPDLPARAKAAGMLFLAKPIKAAALRAALNSLKLQSAAGGPPAAGQ